MFSSTLLPVSVVLVVWLVGILLGKIQRIRNALRDLGDCPGRAILWLHPFRSVSLLLGPYFPPKSQIGSYHNKFYLYKKYGSTCLSSVTLWDTIPTYFVSDPDAIKYISNERHIFEKDTDAYEPLNVYGPNIISRGGAEWKRHRSVVKNAFNEANNAFVWSETCRIIYQWFSVLDSDSSLTRGTPPIDMLSILNQTTFLVIASAGFGTKMDYNSSLDLSQTPVLDYTSTFTSKTPALSFSVSLITASKQFFPRVFAPKFIYPIARRIKIPLISRVLAEITASYNSLKLHMEDVISNARDAWFNENAKNTSETTKGDSMNQGKYKDASAALLRNLVQSNMDEEAGGEKGLKDDELISNTFLFLLAGHETTAHSLCFAIGLLAIHPEVQEKAYSEVYRLWPDAPSSTVAPPEYKDSLPYLDYVSATFYEAIRLYPVVARLGKNVYADTVLKCRRFSTKPDGTINGIEEARIPIKAGSMVVVDIQAVHLNPIHWGDDAAKFKPEHFIDTETYKWPRNAFAGFSQGHRSCIGQRFAMTEAVCVLANLIRHYEILIPAELESKPREEQQKILLAWTVGVTATPVNAWVRLRKRAN
ncbi:hypothetical protein AX17_002479 [Amanita inopinata Kibby_2008]|nr:hypothetical protein AX17_002479 [Amanita inopinata Kibby_2008]